MYKRQDIRGRDLNDKFKKSLAGRSITYSKDRVSNVYAMGDYFAIEIKMGQMIEATSVIVASGIDLGKDLDKEDEFFAKGISYCATCDASLYKQKKVVVIGYNEEAVEEANFTSEIVGELIFINMTKKDVKLNESIKLIEGETPKGFLGDKKAEALLLKSGKKIQADGFFIIRDSSKPDRLIPSIEIEDSHIKVDKNMQTNILSLIHI